MDYSHIEVRDGDLLVRGLRCFSLEEILESGQCFRWERLAPGHYRGIAHGRLLEAEQVADSLRLAAVSREEFEAVWRGYFDLGRDYGAIREALGKLEAMEKAIAFCPGMRVLRQQPFETLCSFILSQNNNIPRIKGLVARLCELAGEPVCGGHAFPTPEALAALSLEDLAPVRSGFRAKYLLDAARRVASGALDLDSLYTAPAAEALAALQEIHGVGPKVASCALLYGFGRAEFLPVDVWIARALEEFFPGGYPPEHALYAGIAQQYLFHYIRNREGAAAL